MSIEAVVESQNPWWRVTGLAPAADYPVRRDLQRNVLQHVGRLDDRRAWVVTGPRQVGKTVLLRQTVEDLLKDGWPAANITYFDFSDDRLAGAPISPRDVTGTKAPGLAEHRPRAFLLDEVSRAQRWADWLKQVVDTTKDRFVLTDSAASLLRDQSLESGFGRWDERVMEGLSFSEFLRLQRPGESAASVLGLLPNATERYLAAGGFPEHACRETFEDARRRLREDIVDRAIKNDLSRLGIDVQQAGALFRFLVQASGSIFDAAARARDLGVDARSIRKWAATLEEARLVVSLQRHTARAAARLRSQPKIYAVDHGLVLAFALMPDPLTDPHVRNAVFEAAVFRHLREAVLRLDGQITYFRRGELLEIDFLVALPGELVAVEVTSSSDPTRKLANLADSSRAAGAKLVLLVHGGSEKRSRSGMVTVPLPHFLLHTDSCLKGEIEQ